MRPRNRRRRASNLIELLVALALVGIVLAAGGHLLVRTFTNETAFREQNDVQQNARTAITTVADDLKGALAKYTTVVMGGVTLTQPTATVQGAAAGSATPSNINSYTTPLYFNIQNDAGTERRVRFWLNGTDLRREVVDYISGTTTVSASSATGGTLIARNITTFTAQKPYDSLSASNPYLNNYSVVRLTVTAQTGISGTADQFSSVTVTTDVTLRNNLL